MPQGGHGEIHGGPARRRADQSKQVASLHADDPSGRVFGDAIARFFRIAAVGQHPTLRNCPK